MGDKTLPILYTFRRCPYAMRARMAIYIAGIDVETIEVSLKNKPHSLLRHSPKGTVPVVVTPTGEVIEQSRDIMTWALHQADPDNWLLQQDDLKRQKMNQLIDGCDNEFKPLLDRYKYFDRHPEHSQLEYRQQAEIFIQLLENQLEQQTFLIDSRIRLVDVAIFPFVRQFAAVDANWFTQSAYKRLHVWLTTCINTDMFKKIMAKS